MFTASLQNVSKRFAGITALDGVSTTFRGGEIHALLGENGAGKSTLINLLAGMQQPDSGQILIEGMPRRIVSPRRSLDLGIGTVSQQLLLVSSLTVLENLMLGGAWWQRLKRAAAMRRFEELALLLGAQIDPNAAVSALSLGQRQQVEIMRALWRDAKLLLLDEPTSMLTPKGVNDLEQVLRTLRNRGAALVLITHKLREAYAFGDRVSILRQGRIIGEIAPQCRQAMSEQEWTQTVLPMMFGVEAPDDCQDSRPRQLDFRNPYAVPALRTRLIDRTRDAILTVHGVSSDAQTGEMPLRHVTLALWAGEVLGIAGIDGNGQKHLAEILAGQRLAITGRIEFAGHDITREGVPERRQQGICYLTDERLGEGSVGTFSIATNLVVKKIGIPPYWMRGVSNWRLINRSAREQIVRHDIRTSSELTPLGKLSGGSIQKVLLVREMDDDATVVILNKPTYGLDLQNQRLVVERISRAAQRGVALIIISTDLDEILALSDRIGVMKEGRLVRLLDNDAEAHGEIGRLMSGALRP